MNFMPYHLAKQIKIKLEYLGLNKKIEINEEELMFY